MTRWILVLLLAGVTGGCKTPEKQAVHVVVCWLKNPGNTSDRESLINTSRSFLGQIPGLLDVQTGPVLNTARPGADATFDVAVVFTFQNEAALRAYDTNPVHQAALRDVLKPRVERLAIYDYIDTLQGINRKRDGAKDFKAK